MKQLLRLVLLIAVTSTVAAGVARIANAAAASDTTPVTQTENDFGFRLLHELLSDGTPDNVIVSPLSVSQALMMTYNGAAASTETSMAQTLGVAAIPRDQLNAANQHLLQALNKADPEVRLAIANALWIDRTFATNPAFLKVNKEFYGADVQSLDFVGNARGAEVVINAWVKRKTHGKIPSIVNDLRKITALVLTDAVYFKASWRSRFDPHSTRPNDFYLANGKSVKTPMMTQKETFQYLENSEFQAIRMPYGNGQLAMYVFLPRKKTA